MIKNFFPKEYKKNRKLKINHSYLIEQFSDYSKIFKEIEKVVKKGDYTLGKKVDECEKSFAKKTGAKFAISVGNGTDALFLSLKALNISKGDEVITTPYTFIATIGSIATSGAKPVFVDVKDDYNIDEKKIEPAITKKTKAIMPVHWSGRPCEMQKIKSITNKYNLKIIQDTCHGIESRYKKKHLIDYGDVCTYSMHPLKNLNIWGDGGFIITQNEKLAKKLLLLRNHGLVDRNKCEIFGFNSRLDTIQAVVANYKMRNKLKNITSKRIRNALLFDKLLKFNKNVRLVKRLSHLKEVFHLYQINVKRRDELQKFLIKNSIDAKVHYPIPIHLQPAAKYLKYKRGDFPMAEKMANTSLSLPVHEFINEKHIKFVVDLIDRFYR
jgi:dTDP-4-amino-4,6-dideoxygalactose transaminase|tara:strand:+ start:42 stop:1187 length:1146 start_codon:yes stop_codon:yes gene_type:complete